MLWSEPGVTITLFFNNWSWLHEFNQGQFFTFYHIKPINGGLNFAIFQSASEDC
jgi:hypothetical protein